MKTSLMSSFISMLSIILFTMLHSPTFGQFNLLLNSSFEDTLGGSPPCYGDIGIAKHWFNPHGATPDFYTFYPGYCSGPTSINNPNGFQIARSGSAYAGIYGYLNPTREYIANTLTDSLVPGSCYFVEFYVALANPCKYSIDNLGAYITDDTSGFKNFLHNISVVPQIINQPGVMLSDTMNWQKIYGTFIAQGTEKFIIIGNFFNDSMTTVDTTFPMNSWLAAYYYVDDVLITPCDSITTIFDQPINLILIYPTPSATEIIVSLKDNSDVFNEINIFDMNGINCISRTPMRKFNNNTIIDISSLVKGLYLLHFTYNEKFILKKFVKF